jgi:Flp pilus assembly protein TadG
MAVLAGAAEFSLIAAARQQLLAASREGARVAATGGSAADAEAVARQTLGGGRLASANVRVVGTAGPGQPSAAGDPVEVWVSLPARAAAPDLLALVGISLGDQSIVTRTALRTE